MDKLKECPFCGAGTTRVVMNGQTWIGTKYSDPISVSVVHHCDPIEGQPSRRIERIGRDAESAIAAWNRRASPASAPAGWKLVPGEPTEEILDVMFDAGIDRHDGDLTILYRAILAAAPTPPPPSKETLEVAGHRLALELECLLLDCKDNVVVSRWMDSACEALDAWQKLFPYTGPRLGD